MLDTAEYFEQRRELDKAVLLYQKAGKERRALELCFSANLLDTLASIASNLTAKSDPAVMARCGTLSRPACRLTREGGGAQERARVSVRICMASHYWLRQVAECASVVALIHQPHELDIVAMQGFPLARKIQLVHHSC